MIGGVTRYFAELGQHMGLRWNVFWYTPADVRPLCLLRLCVGVVGLLYLGSWTTDLLRWFGPDGLLPNATVQAIRDAGMEGRHTLEFSLFQLTDNRLTLWTIHAFSCVALFSFAVGFQTRWSSVLSLFALLGYVHRAPMLAEHTEPILTMLVAYLCLAPSGRYYSVDHWLLRRQGKARTEPASHTVSANVSLRLMQLHLAAMYLMFGLTKLAAEVWWNGEAMWWILAQSDSRLIDFSFLRDYVDVLSLWTHAVVLFELSYAVLIWNRHFRPLMVALSCLMWTLLAVASGLILFCIVMITANLAFVQSRSGRTTSPAQRESVAKERSLQFQDA